MSDLQKRGAEGIEFELREPAAGKRPRKNSTSTPTHTGGDTLWVKDLRAFGPELFIPSTSLC
ncbi:hypothetical protein PROFUN_06268 [Planoprotostelium fungivorum]|uniref:Uncharacterized protein n=1 Tax=Planoprotostelium fungivorum TaxID=1890364 RepID=A0A2P6NE69_9EUKA|nr:hypothetical protein PROFUN_06268 [Planoprotostelium fungivorum]